MNRSCNGNSLIKIYTNNCTDSTWKPKQCRAGCDGSSTTSDLTSKQKENRKIRLQTGIEIATNKTVEISLTFFITSRHITTSG